MEIAPKLTFKVLILCLALIFLAGCQEQNEQIYQLYTNESDNLVKNVDGLRTE